MLVLIAQVSEHTLPGAAARDKVRRALELLGGMGAFVHTGERVLLKPNFVAPFPQAATDLEVVAAVAEAVRACGGEPFLAESSGFEFDTSHTFELLGVSAWAAENGVPLRNLDAGPFVRVATEVGTLEIARSALEVNAIINLPKLKRHNVTRVTLGLKNLMGLLSRDSRRRLHIVGVERGIVALASVLRPRLTVLDALTATSRAVYGAPTPLGVIVAGQDAVAVDHFGCRLLGEDPAHVPHLREAIRQGLGTSLYRVAGDEAVLAPCGGRADSWQERLYRVVFQGMYLLDWPYARLFPGHSCIPAAHYWLGVRPRLAAASCDRCGACVEVCPVGAIDLQRKRIIASRCQRVRCLRCKDVCPRGAIVLRGLRRPERM